MKALISLLALGLALGACTTSEQSASLESAPSLDQPAPPSSEPCHPTSSRTDCVLVIVLMNEPTSMTAAETFAAKRDAHLNVLYRVDPVCVAKDFPTMGGADLGETPSRRTYWEAEARMDRIAQDQATGLVPPATIGGFDVVINQRMSDEWRLAQEPEVLFDNIGLWIDEAAAVALGDEYTVDFPDHWRYEHAEGRGEIALDRHYAPPSLAAIDETDDCQSAL